VSDGNRKLLVLKTSIQMSQQLPAAAALGPETLRRVFPAQFVKQLLVSGTRPDGRKPSDARKTSLNTGTRRASHIAIR